MALVGLQYSYYCSDVSASVSVTVSLLQSQHAPVGGYMRCRRRSAGGEEQQVDRGGANVVQQRSHHLSLLPHRAELEAQVYHAEVLHRQDTNRNVK